MAHLFHCRKQSWCGHTFEGRQSPNYQYSLCGTQIGTCRWPGRGPSEVCGWYLQANIDGFVPVLPQQCCSLCWPPWNTGELLCIVPLITCIELYWITKWIVIELCKPIHLHKFYFYFLCIIYYSKYWMSFSWTWRNPRMCGGWAMMLRQRPFTGHFAVC